MSTRIKGLNAVGPEIIQKDKSIEDSMDLPRRRGMLRSTWRSYNHRKADVSGLSLSKNFHRS
jgi:hypothetical protein